MDNKKYKIQGKNRILVRPETFYVYLMTNQ